MSAHHSSPKPEQPYIPVVPLHTPYDIAKDPNIHPTNRGSIGLSIASVALALGGTYLAYESVTHDIEGLKQSAAAEDAHDKIEGAKYRLPLVDYPKMEAQHNDKKIIEYAIGNSLALGSIVLFGGSIALSRLNRRKSKAS